MKYAGPYIAPTLTVDGVIFQINAGSLEVLLIRRGAEPFKGWWALPGGYNAAGHTTHEALAHVLRHKAGLEMNTLPYMEQLATFDTVARDPRGHAVSVVYMGCGYDITLAHGSEPSQFFSLEALPDVAYDHADIIQQAYERLASKLHYTNIIFGLLPATFTLTQLQNAYEAILRTPLDKRNFRKKFLSLNFIHETGDLWREGAHRPAKLYAFNERSLMTTVQNFAE